MNNELAMIEAKKIGVLLRQMREGHGRSEKDCANWLGVSLEDYQAMEDGATCASLPQAESLAYYLDFPFELLTSASASFGEDRNLSQQVNQELMKVRTKTVAILLKQKREEKKFSLEELAKNTNISPAELSAYEEGIKPVPFSVLLILLDALQVPVGEFFSKEGPFKHEEAEPVAKGFSFPQTLSQEMIDFISKLANLPYVELAMRLSKMDANKIRAIASSLLEITY